MHIGLYMCVCVLHVDTAATACHCANLPPRRSCCKQIRPSRKLRLLASGAIFCVRAAVSNDIHSDPCLLLGMYAGLQAIYLSGWQVSRGRSPVRVCSMHVLCSS